eukprot:4289512-Amphidinium_carterae.1
MRRKARAKERRRCRLALSGQAPQLKEFEHPLSKLSWVQPPLWAETRPPREPISKSNALAEVGSVVVSPSTPP